MPVRFTLLVYLLYTSLQLLQAQTPDKNCRPGEPLQNTSTMIVTTAINVLGTPLQSCCTDPMTGYYRDGYCHTGPTDSGRHVICAEMTQEFLVFTRSRGNDLSTPLPQYNFPGLKPGDRWCLCALRWREAYEAGVAPPVSLESTHEKALDYVSIEMLKEKVLLEQ